MRTTYVRHYSFVIAFIFAVFNVASYGQTTLVNHAFNSGTSYAALAPTLASYITCTTSGTDAFATTTGIASGTSAFTANTTAGTALNMTNSSGTNTRYWTFSIGGGMLNSYKYIKVYLQAKRATTGARTITIATSTDGATFTNFGTTMTGISTSTFSQQVFDLSSVAALNNASAIYIRVMASGATGTGNLCIDNFQVQGVLSGAPGYWNRSGTNTFLSNIGDNVGIGINTPTDKLHINNGILKVSGNNRAGGAMIAFSNNTNDFDWGIEYVSPESGVTVSGLNFWKPFGSYNWGNYKMFISNDGNVGIGTNCFNKGGTTNYYKLAVNGNVHAKIIVVDMNDWCDYVFDKSYKLNSLSEVEKYINEHKHLPDVPSAVDVEKDGLNLGESNAILLKKIEELTLYIIEQNKQIIEQKEKMEQVENTIKILQEKN